MSDAAKKVLATLLEMPPDEREGVSRAGGEPADDEDDRFDDEYEAELDRRIAAMESGEDPCVPADEVFSRLEKKYA